MLRDTVATKLRTTGYAARHTAKKPAARWMAGIAAAAAVGAIAVTAVASGASASTATPTSARQQATRDAVTKRAPADLAGQPATHPAITSKSASAGTRAASTTPTAATASHAAHAAATAATAPKHAAHAVAKPAASSKPATIYDSVTPSSIPAGTDAAVYADGTYQASAASVASHKNVLWIDTNGSRTDANALDVEPGDATPAGAAAWVKAKLTKDPSATAIIYTFKSNWPATTAAINALPKTMQSHVKYWIADPTGTKHILPGAAATQWYWGPSYDISSAKAGFTS
jgi:hypothetical protein